MNEDNQLKRIDQVLNDTMECYSVCQEMITYCLQMGGEHAEYKHMEAMIDCTKACQMTVDFLLRDSGMGKKVIQLAEEAAMRCSVSCRNHSDDENMMTCAEVCDKAAESLREFRD